MRQPFYLVAEKENAVVSTFEIYWTTKPTKKNVVTLCGLACLLCSVVVFRF